MTLPAVTFDTLLSGLIGAIFGSIMIVSFQYYFDKKNKEYLLAKERLEKIYSPLLVIFDANKSPALKEEKFNYTKREERYMDKLFLNNYYLIEEEKRTMLLNLYNHRKFSENVMEKDIISAIKKGYMENWGKLRRY